MKYLPPLAFALLLAALLIGQRFGFAWAGGEGYLPERGADVVGASVHYDRGETVRTTDDRVRLAVGSHGTIALDWNTDLTLVETNDRAVTVRLMRGRIYADFPLTITTNYVTATATEALSVVNYDFLETVSVIPINVSAAVTVRDHEAFTTEKPVNIHETPPVSIDTFAFDPSTNDPGGFYAWAIE